MQDEPWRAQQPPAGLNATVEVPGSKSLTNRLLVLAALSPAPSTLRGALRSRDTDLMINALRTLFRATITESGIPSTLHIERSGGSGTGAAPAAARVADEPLHIDCGLAGTVMRFVPPLAALTGRTVTFDGDREARNRPMGPLLDALRQLGVPVTGPGGVDTPETLPFTVPGSGAVEGGIVEVDASGSSQFVSGLLLAGCRFRNGLTVRHTGASLPSIPHVEMTLDVLRDAGLDVDSGTHDGRPWWRVEPGRPTVGDLRIEPDLSNAAPFLAAALVAGGVVRVPGWPASSTQPGMLVPELLTRMGGTADLRDGVLEMRGSGVVHGIDVDLREAGELAPTIAALAALADSPSRLRGIAHLRGHETDRLAALARELSRVGADARETGDGLVIEPGPLHAEVFHTYHDHRMATSGALIGLAVPGLQVENIQTTAKTLPGFTGLWTAMLSGD